METIKRTIRYVSATAAEWATSTRVLAVNEVAIISDDPTRIKTGRAVNFYQTDNKIGLTFAQLPYQDLGDAPYKTPVILANRFALNVTGTLTAAQLLKKYISSTSAAAVAATLPTVAALLAAVGITAAAAALAVEFDFVVDNLFGASSVTVTLPALLTVPGTVGLTGGGNLVVVAGSIGKFKIIVKDMTHGLIFRTL